MYFFFSLVVANHVVDSIQSADKSAMIGVSSPRSSPRPPKNSTNPANGTIAVGIPMFFIQLPCLCEVSFGYPCIMNRVPTASLRSIDEMSTYEANSTIGVPPFLIARGSSSLHRYAYGIRYKVSSQLLLSRSDESYQVNPR